MHTLCIPLPKEPPFLPHPGPWSDTSPSYPASPPTPASSRTAPASSSSGWGRSAPWWSAATPSIASPPPSRSPVAASGSGPSRAWREGPAVPAAATMAAAAAAAAAAGGSAASSPRLRARPSSELWTGERTWPLPPPMPSAPGRGGDATGGSGRPSSPAPTAAWATRRHAPWRSGTGPQSSWRAGRRPGAPPPRTASTPRWKERQGEGRGKGGGPSLAGWTWRHSSPSAPSPGGCARRGFGSTPCSTTQGTLPRRGCRSTI